MSTVGPIRIVPESGCSDPVSIRKSVVLPAPLGPIMPTMPPGGRRNEKFSISTLSPKALLTFSASTTRSPIGLPAGMKSSISSSRPADCSAASFSNDATRALLFAWRALGDKRIHSSSLSSVFCRTLAAFSSSAKRARFCSSHDE